MESIIAAGEVQSFMSNGHRFIPVSELRRYLMEKATLAEGICQGIAEALHDGLIIELRLNELGHMIYQRTSKQ